MGINVEKKDGPSSSAVLGERLQVGKNEKGQRVGGFDGKKIFVRKGKRLVFSEDKKLKSKVNEFKELVKRAEAEHEKTATAVVEEAVPDVTVNEDIANSVLSNSIERVEGEIDERVADI